MGWLSDAWDSVTDWSTDLFEELYTFDEMVKFGENFASGVEDYFNPEMPEVPEAVIPARAISNRQDTGAQIRIGDSADAVRNQRVSGGNPLGGLGRSSVGLNI